MNGRRPMSYVYPDSSRYSRRDFDALARLYVGLDGAPMDALPAAIRVGMSETTARWFLHRNNLVRRHPTKRRGPWAARLRRQCRARQLEAEGKTRRQIARMLHVHPETVRTYLLPDDASDEERRGADPTTGAPRRSDARVVAPTLRGGESAL